MLQICLHALQTMLLILPIFLKVNLVRRLFMEVEMIHHCIPNIPYNTNIYCYLYGHQRFHVPAPVFDYSPKVSACLQLTGDVCDDKSCRKIYLSLVRILTV